MKLEIKKKLLNRSERVKSVELHPSLPWVLIGLYSGTVAIFDYNTQSCVKQFEISKEPVRCARFVIRKEWIVAGTDDNNIQVYNYTTSEKIKTISAHGDYIRAVIVHPQQPYVISCSDDLTIKVWDWEKNWQEVNCYEDHEHYIMQIVLNPKDVNTFASASLDKTVKIWNVSTTTKTANYSLLGHQAGVNCVDYSHTTDRPHLLSGGDDSMVKLWDYQTKQCLYTFDGHNDNISAVAFHPELPILISAGEDGKVNVWNSITFELETNLNYGLDRAWAIHAVKNSNYVALAYDEATVVIKIGKETPIVSFNNGRVLWGKQGEVQLANLKSIKDDLSDGEEVDPKFKDLGHSEIFAQDIKFAPNGKYFALCGDSDYVIYSTFKFNNSGFGHAVDLVWGQDNDYAVLNDHNTIQIFKNFVEDKSYKTSFKNHGIFGGKLIGVSTKQGGSSISFFDWETFTCIRRIDVETPKNVYWSSSGEYVVICLEDCFYVLRYNENVVKKHIQTKGAANIGEEGIEEAFTFLSDFNEEVVSGEWVSGDAFVFTTAKGKLNYLIGDKVINHALVDKKMFVLGYVPQKNRIFLINKALKITSYELLTSVIQAQREIVRTEPGLTTRDPEYKKLKDLIDQVPETHIGKIAKFLESMNFKDIAYHVTVDDEHKFDLAVALNKIRDAYEIALKDPNNYEKLRKVGDISLKIGDIKLAEQCYLKSNDYNSLLLIYSSLGDAEGMKHVAEQAMNDKKYNIAYQCYFALSMPSNCYEILIEANRIPEAAMFARAYLPSKLGHVMNLWKEKVKDKPYVPTSLSDISEHVSTIDLAIRIESVLSEYYSKEKESASKYESAYHRHFQEISQQVEAGIDTDLSKPLFESGSYHAEQQPEEEETQEQNYYQEDTNDAANEPNEEIDY